MSGGLLLVKVPPAHVGVVPTAHANSQLSSTPTSQIEEATAQLGQTELGALTALDTWALAANIDFCLGVDNAILKQASVALGCDPTTDWLAHKRLYLPTRLAGLTLALRDERGRHHR
ncbi:hypothetical protein T492DRAFT_863859, partial [Pavlovales sp. CCMP2436]